MPSAQKHAALLSYAAQDPFFEKVLNDLGDFGHEVSFSFWGGAGAYIPFAVQTEALDTPTKQAQFYQGFWKITESGQFKARFRLSSLMGVHGNAHSFLHELMHFYQDMYGLYLLPIQEEGAFPVILDAYSDIVAILFCEAYAQVEAIRASWRLLQSGNDLGWRGALSSPDWAGMAKVYEQDLQSGMAEEEAASQALRYWYQGKHRHFYERHALQAYEQNFRRYGKELGANKTNDVSQFQRSLKIPMLLARLPQDDVPAYLKKTDWGDPLFTDIQNPKVRKKLLVLEGQHGQADSDNIQDIKCGTPAYIWHRLRMDAQNNADVPPMDMQSILKSQGQ